MQALGALGASTLELLAYSPPGWGATLLRGLWNSVQIATGAFALGCLIGIAGAYGKLYGSPWVKDLMAIYTTVVRAVPELVLILILYFAVTDAVNQLVLAMGGSRIEINGVAAGIAVLGIVQGAYATEVLRGAILAVPSGQIEAARAMGMPPLRLAQRIAVRQQAHQGGGVEIGAAVDVALLARHHLGQFAASRRHAPTFGQAAQPDQVMTQVMAQGGKAHRQRRVQPGTLVQHQQQMNSGVHLRQ